MNDQKQNTTEEGQPKAEPTAQQQPEGRKKPNWVARILGGDVLQSRAVLRQGPLIVLLCFYAILLVYNRYRVEDLTKERAAAQERITYLREARIELQKRYQETIKISQIAELLEGTGIGITAGPPYELDVDGMERYLK
ncbi:MAG: hypothetical protein IJ785_01700 [Bacteroidales bacterium]|nr:hypothetical protein [Bacteroidales bacterium]